MGSNWSVGCVYSLLVAKWIASTRGMQWRPTRDSATKFVIAYSASAPTEIDRPPSESVSLEISDLHYSRRRREEEEGDLGGWDCSVRKPNNCTKRPACHLCCDMCSAGHIVTHFIALVVPRALSSLVVVETESRPPTNQVFLRWKTTNIPAVKYSG